MGQASVLNDNEIRRVFRIIETTRHASRNRLVFVLSFYAGLRVGEIAALTIGDVATSDGEPRREIKLSAHQTKGLKGSNCSSIEPRSIRDRCISQAALDQRPKCTSDRIPAQWESIFCGYTVDAFQRNL